MMSAISCELNRVINAPIEKVFDAWIDPEQLRQWHCPEGFVVPSCESNGVVGGSYSIVMSNPSAGHESTVIGTYLEIERPTKIVMTWEWKENDNEKTEVTILLKEISANETEINLTHRLFLTEESMQNHREGWISVLESLNKFIA